MLCIKRYSTMTYITIAGLYVNHLPLRLYRQYTFALSWDLLAWIPGDDKIPWSFTNFITTAELSGPLYISPDIYHTQVTEYLLETILQRYDPEWALFSLHRKSFNCYSGRFRPGSVSYYRSLWAFREHISFALPIKSIFYLLRSIHPNFFIRIRDGSRDLNLQVESLEIIIKWLQVSVSKCNRQIP